MTGFDKYKPVKHEQEMIYHCLTMAHASNNSSKWILTSLFPKFETKEKKEKKMQSNSLI